MRSGILLALLCIASLCRAETALSQSLEDLFSLDETYVVSAPPAGGPLAGNGLETRHLAPARNSLTNFFAFDPPNREGVVPVPSEDGPVIQGARPSEYFEPFLPNPGSFQAFDPSRGPGQGLGFSPGFGFDPFPALRRQ